MPYAGLVGGATLRLVERFWSPREGEYALDSDGFLRDPDITFAGERLANGGVLRTADFQGARCVVLLGEPGSGKSTVVGQPARLVADAVSVLQFDLASYGSEDRLVQEVLDIRW